MKTGGKTRVGLTLSLGVLMGLGLVILPGFFATPTTNSTSIGANVRNPTTTYTAASGNSVDKINQPTTQTTGVAVSLAFILALILLPAISLSIFVRYWSLKTAKSRLESEYS